MGGPKGQLTCIYGCGPHLTGQRLASELLVAGLRQRGWSVRVLTMPLLPRTADGKGRWQAVGLVLRLVPAELQALAAALSPDILCVNLGQTSFAMIRDGLALLLRRALRRPGRAVVALHGDLFTQWAPGSRQARILRGILAAASRVTVLGERQKAHLVRLGVPPDRVAHVDNTCALPPISAEACRRKQALAAEEPLRVLFLSNLLESKGYPEFLAALALLGQRSRRPVEAILCGQVVLSDEDGRFRSVAEASRWIEARLAAINGHGRCQVRWIQGAYGREKEALFHQSHVFVLPTRYPVEAQPLVLLEALASGCAIITTRQGEIPSTLSPETAILLAEATPDALADALVRLAQDDATRLRLALAGLELFRARFSLDRHLDRWEELLANV